MPDPALRIQGRIPNTIRGEFVRPLVEADLAALTTPRGSKPPLIKELRERHHSLARAVASGQTDYEASVTTGYSIGRISILKADPTFAELVAFYRENANAAYVDLHARMGTLAADAVSELQNRLEDAPETLPSPLLLDVAKTFADRTGHAPITRSINAHLSADVGSRLNEARRRAGLVPAEEAA